MARTRSTRRKTRKHRGGDYLNDYEKKEAANAAAEKKRSANAAYARAAERAARTPAAIKAAKEEEVAKLSNHAKKALHTLKNAGLGPGPKHKSEHLEAAHQAHKNFEKRWLGL
jgi:ribosomal protein L34E